MKIIENKSIKCSQIEKKQFLQDWHIILKWKLFKKVLSRSPYPPKMKFVQNQSFQDHQTISKLKSSKFRPPHHPKVKIIENQSFYGHPTYSGFCKNKTVQGNHTLPKWTVLKANPLNTTTPYLTKTCYKKQSFQDHHFLPKWSLSKSCPLKTTTLSHS